MKKSVYLFYVLFLLIVSLMRILPHPTGCSPLIAASLFITMTAPKQIKSFCYLALPAFFLLTAQLQTGFWQGWWIQPVSLLVVLLSTSKFKATSFESSVGLGFVSSVIFFLVSNTGAWIAHALPYPMTFAGWLDCMAMGIPYFRPQLAWDVLFTASIFSAYGFMLVPKRSVAVA